MQRYLLESIEEAFMSFIYRLLFRFTVLWVLFLFFCTYWELSVDF